MQAQWQCSDRFACLPWWSIQRFERAMNGEHVAALALCVRSHSSFRAAAEDVAGAEDAAAEAAAVEFAGALIRFNI